MTDPLGEKIIAKCAELHPTFKADCVDFAAAVLKHFFADPDFDANVLANAVVARLKAAAYGWRTTRSIPEAIASAKAGRLVLAAMTGTPNGHVAVVIGKDGELSQGIVVPVGYAGSIGGGAIAGKGLNWTFEARLVRESKIDYYIKAPDLQPALSAAAMLMELGGRILARRRYLSGTQAVPQMAWGRKVSPEFRMAVFNLCARLGMQADYLMAAMAFETGESFDPAKRNKVSGATGLIQFMKSTAEDLGTTLDELAAMSAVQQLAFVEKYFLPYHGRLGDLGDVYMAILWPKAIGKPDDHAIFVAGSKYYEQNKGLDLNKDGQVTRHEAASKVKSRLEKGLKAGFYG